MKAALPYLRKASGRIIFTSSGAALNAYSTWGAYGSSKAALNHLAMTLKNEEPNITSISIRPGMVDTDMQRDLREVHHTTMDEKDRKKFLGAKKDGSLLQPEQPGNVIARLAVEAPKDLSGQFLRYDFSVTGYQHKTDKYQLERRGVEGVSGLKTGLVLFYQPARRQLDSSSRTTPKMTKKN